jgi:hypothetical protein
MRTHNLGCGKQADIVHEYIGVVPYLAVVSIKVGQVEMDDSYVNFLAAPLSLGTFISPQNEFVPKRDKKIGAAAGTLPIFCISPHATHVIIIYFRFYTLSLLSYVRTTNTRFQLGMLR